MSRTLTLALLAALPSACVFDPSGLAPEDLADRGPTDGPPGDRPPAAEHDGPHDGPSADRHPACKVWNPAWTRRSRLTFDNLFADAALDGPRVDFPVLIRLTPARMAGLELRGDGADLRFIDADDKTVLAFEVEVWAPKGTSTVWVKVPTIDKASRKDFIWLYHGNANAKALPSAAKQVWSNGFRAVWHLSQDPAAAAPQFTDSVGGNHATVEGKLTGAHRVAGVAGSAVNFTGQTTDRLVAPDSASLDVSKAVTLEAWVRPASIDTAANRYPVSKNAAYFLQVLRSHATYPGIYVHLGVGLNWFAVNTKLSPKAGAWCYIAGTYETSDRILRAYLDGVLRNHADLSAKGVPATSAINNSTANLYIGKGVEGPIDEVRISAVMRAPGWIAAQHRSMTDAFVTYGAAQVTCP
jgi:biopolymer transport protein ExbB